MLKTLKETWKLLSISSYLYCYTESYRKKCTWRRFWDLKCVSPGSSWYTWRSRMRLRLGLKKKVSKYKIRFFHIKLLLFSALKARIWVDAYFVVILIDLILYLGFCIILPDHRTILSSMDNRTKPKVSFQIYSTKLWNHWWRNTIQIKRSWIDM